MRDGSRSRGRWLAALLGALVVAVAITIPGELRPTRAEGAPGTRPCAPDDKAVLHSGWPEAQPSFVVPIANPLSEEEFFGEDDDEPAVTRGVFRRGERGRVVRKNQAAKAGPKSKPAGFKFFPGLAPLDPIIAVSPNFIVMTDAGSDPDAPGGGGRIIFLDRAQQQNNQGATPLAPGPGGAPTKLTLTKFFGGLIAPTNPDGTVNQNNINCHLDLGASAPIGCDSTKPPAEVRDSWRPNHACVNEFYDARVFYRPDDQRFVVVAHARNSIWSTADWMKKTAEDFAEHGLNDFEIQKLYDSGPEARRYVAIAVSRSADPRDGFNEYITTTSNYADWPVAAVGENGIVVGHRSPAETGKPSIYWFSLTAAENNVSSPAYKEFSKQDFGGAGAPKPVTSYGDAKGLFWFVNDRTTPTRIDALPDDANVSGATPFGSAVSPPHGALQNNGISTPPVYRNGKVCSATAIRVEDDPLRNSIRVTCFRVDHPSPSSITVSASGQGARDRVFGLNAPQDAPGDRVSYEDPVLTVNENGDILIAYARFGAKTKDPLNPEARYTLWYHDESKPRRSRVLKLGESDCCPHARVDLMSAVVDPVNDATVWMSDMYARNDATMSTVVGRVKP
jgi:hypothetical protein